MIPTASFYLKQLSTECTDPARAELKMKSTTKTLLRRNKSILKRNFLQKMILKGLGTNKVESIAESLARDTNKTGKAKEAMKRNFLTNIMTLKAKDAEEDVKENEYKYHRSKRDLGKDINEEVLPRFRQFYLSVAEKEWEDEKKTRQGQTSRKEVQKPKRSS